MRHWIEKNRAYFELLTPVILSIAALLVSIASYRISKSQLDIQAEQLSPHFYISYASDPDKKLTPNIEIKNDGETFESLQIIPMPFISGFNVNSGSRLFNAPVFTHQTIVRSGQKKDLVATVKSDVPIEFLRNTDQNQSKFSFLDKNPRILLLLVWKTKSDSGVQFFAGEEPVEATKAESCYAYWHSKSEDSPSPDRLKPLEFATYIASISQLAGRGKDRTDRSKNVGCIFPS